MVYGTNYTFLCKTSLRKNPYYATAYVFWSKVIFLELIPYAVIVIFNGVIIYKIFKLDNFQKQNFAAPEQNDNEEETKPLSKNVSKIQNKKPKEIDMAITLIAISITFVLCQSVKLVADVYELMVCDHFKIAKDGYDPQCNNPIGIDVVISFGNLFVCVNSAANFLMYMIKGKKFREAFCQTYFSCWKKEENDQQNSINMYQMTQRSSIL